MIMKRFCLFFLAMLMLASCVKKEENVAPKPRGFFRIDLPEHAYQKLDTVLPFTFDYSQHAVCTFEDKDSGRYWINITYPKYNVALKMSYLTLHNDLRDMVVAEEKMVQFHYVKADDVEYSVVMDPQAHVYGKIYDIKGRDVACPFQFWLTDSVRHYLRSSLYFNCVPENDSLRPVIDYIREDAMAMINSFQWKK